MTKMFLDNVFYDMPLGAKIKKIDHKANESIEDARKIGFSYFMENPYWKAYYVKAPVRVKRYLDFSFGVNGLEWERSSKVGRRVRMFLAQKAGLALKACRRGDWQWIYDHAQSGMKKGIVCQIMSFRGWEVKIKQGA